MFEWTSIFNETREILDLLCSLQVYLSKDISLMSF